MGFTQKVKRLLQRQSLTPMTYFFARIASSAALAALVTGCAVVPGDPYYTPQPSGYGVYEQPAYIYGSPPPAYGYPVAPPPGYYGRSYDDRNAWRERERAQREREVQREREALREREARRDRERDQARRDQIQRDQARRDQDQRQRIDGTRPERAEPPRSRSEERPRREDESRQRNEGTRSDQPRWRTDAPRGQGS